MDLRRQFLKEFRDTKNLPKGQNYYSFENIADWWLAKIEEPKGLEEILEEFDSRFDDITHFDCLDKDVRCETMAKDVKSFITKAYLTGKLNGSRVAQAAEKERIKKVAKEFIQQLKDYEDKTSL